MESEERGTHGYDNRLPSMKPIFYARGPNFKKNFQTSPFKSVDIYILICELLDVTPAPNNGTLEITREFLVPSQVGRGSSVTVPWYLIVVEVIMFYVCLRR